MGPWLDGSMPCGIGKKLRAVACFDTTSNKAAVSDWFCKRISRKPKDQIPCNRYACDRFNSHPNGHWIQGEWSRCSVTCDKVYLGRHIL